MATNAEEFQMKGFTQARALFSAEEAVEMRENFERYSREIAPGLPPAAVVSFDGDDVAANDRDYVFFARMDLYDPFFEKLRHHPKLGELAAQLLGTDVEAQHVQFLNVVPEVCKATPPHQDAPIFAIEPSHAVTFWIPLCDVDEQNACLCYVAGSQWQGHLPHAESGPRRLAEHEQWRDKGTAVPASPGDVLAHHCFTIHYSADNLSGKQRPALAVHFYPKGAVAMNPDEWLRRKAG